nr:MAG TPA: putative acylphosphatase [Caudoviricetes sp.]
MIVVGLYSTLSNLSDGTVFLDFEGNEGDMWEEEGKDLIPYKA